MPGSIRKEKDSTTAPISTKAPVTAWRLRRSRVVSRWSRGTFSHSDRRTVRPTAPITSATLRAAPASRRTRCEATWAAQPALVELVETTGGGEARDEGTVVSTGSTDEGGGL